MLHPHRRADDPGVEHGTFGVFIERVLDLVDRAFHAVAVLARRLLAQDAENLLQPLDLVLCVFKMGQETLLQLRGFGCFGAFGERLDQLIFGAV